ncbi:hypothetical protein [Micromonospora sp. NPDC092111]|uniref:hypothetical protein n=1 Tax=Micromonospora sp. NPDC092111 TaxID=3364289 RepID=UPI0037FD613F
MLVIPVTFNTVNKWAVGASDTLALGILNEAVGSGLPIHVFPRVKATLAAHPAYAGHVRLLQEAGVVFHDGDLLRPPATRWRPTDGRSWSTPSGGQAIRPAGHERERPRYARYVYRSSTERVEWLRSTSDASAREWRGCR